MAQPTIEKRLQRKFIVMSCDERLLAQLRAALPAGWEMAATTDLNEVGGWSEILLYRFLLLDLDETAFDPLEVMQTLRTELMLQTAVFCFGGSAGLRDAMRLARADRFFERDEIVRVLPQFLAQYGWGR